MPIRARKTTRRAAPAATFNAPRAADVADIASGIARKAVDFARGETIFMQGDVCDDVLYIRTGCVKLSVSSKTGREAVVATLGPGEFFGEGCLAGQRTRSGSATAVTPSVILAVAKARMRRLLHGHHALSDRFISHMLARNIRTEEDLLGQLFNSSEKRLARTLLRLARYGTPDEPTRLVPATSQQTLADACGTTTTRVRALLHKFKNQGFIESNGRQRLSVNRSLLNVVLHD